MAQNYGGLFECPHCGKIINYVGPFKTHVKSCKKKMCGKCEEKGNCRYNNPEMWFLDCPHKNKTIN